MGVGVLDLLFGPLVLAGIERVSLTPGQAPGFSLDYIDWSHSLTTTVVWSVLFGLFFLKQGREIGGVMAAAVFSHFVLDWVMHPSDLALWPGSTTHLGLGLWRTWPIGWWWMELLVVSLLLGYYLKRAKGSAVFGGRGVTACAVVVILHVLNSPWLSAF